MSCLGQFLIDSIQVSHLHMSRDTVRPGAGQGCRNAASTKGRSEFAHRLERSELIKFGYLSAEFFADGETACERARKFTIA